jgi:hypothetical protein
MIKHLLILLVLLCITGCYLSNHYINIAKITVKVVDENGNVIRGANVGFSSFIGAATKKFDSVKGITDENGIFSGWIEATNEIAVAGYKDGYYRSMIPYYFKGFKFKRWQPWNPEIRIMLYKIGNRVPMYARNTEYSKIELPVIGKKVGFDLIEFDWVSPYGKGVHPDMIFKLDKKYTDWDNFSSKLTVSFSNKYDGIQLVKQDRSVGSGLKLSRFAPEDGYQNELTHYKEDMPKTIMKESFKEDSNYFFRVRSEVKNGKLVRAMYGKIYGDIVFEPRTSRTAFIRFKYFLNPDYTRNMEFDPKRNLFTGLSDLERNGLQ